MQNALHTLTIRNFKGIESLQLDNLNQNSLTIFTGHCKTTVLEAILLLASGGSSNVRTAIQQLRGMKDDPPAKSWFHNLNAPEAVIEAETAERHYSLTLSLKTKTESAQDPMQAIQNFDNRKILHAALQIRKGPDLHTFESGGPGPGPEERIPACLSLGIPDREHVNRKLQQKQKESLLSAMQAAEPRIEDLLTDGNGQIHADIGLESFIPLEALGQGPAMLLNAASSPPACKNGLFLLDNAFDGLSRPAGEKLAQLLKSARSAHNVQVFAATHHPDAAALLQSGEDQERHAALINLR